MVDQQIGFNELLQILTEMYEQKIPFNKVLGLRVESLKLEKVELRFDMKEEFIGNYTHGILHGGVISSVLDATGGIIATIGTLQKMAGYPIEEIKNRITKVGAIDLRVDYLRPGRGDYFISTGSIMRAGRKVSVTRMELHNDQDLLIAVGTGTYIVG
jgi:uncharacterized protein (TIGR00369 family)